MSEMAAGDGGAEKYLVDVSTWRMVLLAITGMDARQSLS
jgi:hypothetical protein